MLDIFKECTNKFVKCCVRKDIPYVNKYDIDDYIDEWWMYNCPTKYSNTEINNQVYNLLHQLFLIDVEDVSL